MQNILNLSKEELLKLSEELKKQYEGYLAKNLKLDMSRGKPGADQLDITEPLLSILKSSEECIIGNVDTRNYGGLEGIKEARQIFAELLEVSIDEVIVGGNSSLNLMYDTIARAMNFGVVGSEKAWGKYEKIKFLCPAPGYDRHFGICEHFGIEMITIKMTETGPDMDTVEKLVSEDETIKGIWCVPKYSNPDGFTYSDETVKRFANLKPKAKDFRIFWDNAYCVHDLYDTSENLLNIMAECKKTGNENMPFIFTSTSKISFPGAGISAMAASVQNLDQIKKLMFFQTIGPDKISQLRHVKYYKDANGIKEYMKKHAEILRPKFEVILKTLEKELAGTGLATWNNPKGGYFVSVNVYAGCAKKTVKLLADAGVVMTGAGATYPYKNDPQDENLRIAPTYPPLSELNVAIELFCVCVKIAAVEKLLNK